MIDALGRTKPFDAVDVLHALGDQPTTLAMQTLGVFLFDTRYAHHAARLRLPAQITDQRTNHPTASIRSVFARRARRFTCKLAGSRTWL